MQWTGHRFTLEHSELFPFLSMIHRKQSHSFVFLSRISPTNSKAAFTVAVRIVRGTMDAFRILRIVVVVAP